MVTAGAEGGRSSAWVHATDSPPGNLRKVELDVSVPQPKRWDLETPKPIPGANQRSSGRRRWPTFTTSPSASAPSSSRRARDSSSTAAACRFKARATTTISVRWARRSNVRALERQLEILKEMGCNALRTSHNPPAPELLDLADRMGFLVMVESFDCWRRGKTAGDYSRLFDDWHARDLQAMVRRERNHPSVIMWSIGNEIHEQNGPGLAKTLRDIVHAEDPTRPVTAGCNNPSAGTNGFQTAVDVFGLNYHPRDYKRILDHPGNEQKPMHTAESSSCVSSRGEYFFPVKRGKASEVDYQVSSYDVDAPPWAQPPDEVFEALDRNPAFFGEFVWTGFDYLGEPTPYNNDTHEPAQLF